MHWTHSAERSYDSEADGGDWISITLSTHNYIMESPQHSNNTDNKFGDNVAINEISKLVGNLKEANSLRQLISLLTAQLEETLLEDSEHDSTDSSIYGTPDKIMVLATPKRRVGMTETGVGYLLNVSTDTDESVRVTDPTPSPIRYFSPYVELIRDLVIDDNLATSLTEEATSLFPRSLSPSNNRVKYSWLNTDNIPYIFGHSFYPAIDIAQYESINSLMKIIDTQTGSFGLDSCLLAYYERGEVTLSYHSDDEPEIDQSAPIVVLSLGAPRTLSFCKKDTRKQPIGQLELADCSIAVMKPGCQQELVHSVLPNPGCQGRRISLSFRKTKKQLDTRPARTLSKEWKTSPVYVPPPTPGLPLPQPEEPSLPPPPPVLPLSPQHLPLPRPPPAIPLHASIRKHTFAEVVVGITPVRQQKMAPRVLTDGYQGSTLDIPPYPGSLKKEEGPKADPTPKPTPQHLVIGDSLVRDVWLPNCVTVSVSGGKPSDILHHIRKNKFELIPEEKYSCIRSITVCCGTNSVGRPHIPLYELKSDFDMLLRELIGLFPNARIALVNVPPRRYSSPEVIDRIYDFNSFLYHIANSCYPKISFIDLFRQLLRPNRYINKRYYRSDLLHFNDLGTHMLMDKISEFHRYGEYF